LDQLWVNVREKTGQNDSILWYTFLDLFLEKLGVSDRHTQNKTTLHQLQYFFQVKRESDPITKEIFELFKSLFSSLFPSSSSPLEGNKFLKSICELYSQNFFFGFQSRDEATKILNRCKNGSFLIRISKNEKRLVLSCLIISPPHKFVEHEHYNFGKDRPILEEYVRDCLAGYEIAQNKGEYFNK